MLIIIKTEAEANNEAIKTRLIVAKYYLKKQASANKEAMKTRQTDAECHKK